MLFDSLALRPLLDSLQTSKNYGLNAEWTLAIISAFHQMKTIETLKHPYDHDIGRVFTSGHAPHYVSPSVLGASWADSVEAPLRNGDAWNTGRHASLTGYQYQIGANGFPINPYMQTGIAGQGVNGPFGPSHIVDLALFEYSAGGALCLRAINKGPMRLLCGGYVEGTNYDDPSSRFANALAHEMFEELISGSVALLPNYCQHLDANIAAYIGERQTKNPSYQPSDRDITRITREQETQLKLAQVKQNDPEFWDKLHTYCAELTCAYRGLISASNRNTDNAWVESAMYWGVMNDATWENMRGPRPKFNYAFAAGDDADDQGVYVIDRDLLETMPGTHAAMVMYGFLQHLASMDAPPSPRLMAQFQDNLSYMRWLDRFRINHPDAFVPGVRGVPAPRLTMSHSGGPQAYLSLSAPPFLRSSRMIHLRSVPTLH
jgi:hypothetical protein